MTKNEQKIARTYRSTPAQEKQIKENYQAYLKKIGFHVSFNSWALSRLLKK